MEVSRMTPKECIISEVENIKRMSEQWKGNEVQVRMLSWGAFYLSKEAKMGLELRRET